ncbi:MAG TPA: CopG family transcriptional regulator [Kofleriaceae bacterium]|jgi:hypothetical protein|nr:CopG family transcriptional regulator [Kofleriaceae bacterium]
MTTTVTLDPDLAKKVKVLARRRGRSFQQTLNEVIRRGLIALARQDPQPRYTLEPHPGGFHPGVDPSKLNQLVDQLEVEEFIAKTQR